MKNALQIIVLLTCCFTSSFGDSWSEIGQKFKNFGNGIADQAKSIIKGFESMGGVVPSGYIYSFRVFNGTQSDLTVKTLDAKKIMGARIDGSTKDSLLIHPGEDTGALFSNVHLLFSIGIDNCNFTEDHYTLGEQNDTTIYAYHAYQDTSLANQCEKVGELALTNDFSGMIYNGLSSEAIIGIPFNGKKVEITVEPDTYNSLQSTNELSFRPGSLFLDKTEIILSKNGLGVKVSSGEGEQKKDQVYPSRYNYEILPSGQGIETGITPGNFKQPTNGKIRDITPVQVNIWNPPVKDPSVDSSSMDIDLSSEPLWVMYTGQAISNEGKTISNPITFIPSGKCLSLYILRPSVAQAVAQLFLVRLNTTDQNKAVQFLGSLANTKLPQYDFSAMNFSLANEDKAQLLKTKLPDKIGTITAQGLTGVIVGTDIFTSYGLASSGPFYYSVPIPSFAVGNVYSTFLQGLNPLNPAAQIDLLKNIKIWVNQYKIDPVGTRENVEKYIIQNGVSQLITVNGAHSSLNLQGLSFLSTCMYGPTSISRMPVLYQTVSSSSGATPQNWAATADIVTL